VQHWGWGLQHSLEGTLSPALFDEHSTLLQAPIHLHLLHLHKRKVERNSWLLATGVILYLDLNGVAGSRAANEFGKENYCSYESSAHEDHLREIINQQLHEPRTDPPATDMRRRMQLQKSLHSSSFLE
jgi:hypothetical protein